MCGLTRVQPKQCTLNFYKKGENHNYGYQEKSKAELSAIAHRAVATRRANIEKRRRSEIALRAAATRRENAAK